MDEMAVKPIDYAAASNISRAVIPLKSEPMVD